MTKKDIYDHVFFIWCIKNWPMAILMFGAVVSILHEGFIVSFHWPHMMIGFGLGYFLGERKK